MNYLIIDICRRIPNASLITIIKNNLSNDITCCDFLYTKNISKKKYFKGFTKFKSIPLNFKIKQIFVDSQNISPIAKQTLSTWFNDNQELSSEISSFLSSNNYKPVLPSFNDNFISVKSLSDEMIVVEDKLTFLNYKIDSLKKEQKILNTLMAFLLGYAFGLDLSEDSEIGADDNEQTKETIKAESEGYEDCNEIPEIKPVSMSESAFNSTKDYYKVNDNNSQKNTSKSNNSNKNYDITSQPQNSQPFENDLDSIVFHNFITDTYKLLTDYNEIVQKIISLFESEAQTIKNGRQINNYLFEKDLPQLLTIYNKLAPNLSDAHKNSIYILDQLKSLLHFENEEPGDTSIDINLKNIEKLANQYFSNFESKLQEADKLLSKLPAEISADYNNIINALKSTDSSSLSCHNLKENQSKLIDIIAYANYEINSYSLESALEDIRNQKYTRGIDFIHNYIVNNGSEFDFFLFILITSSHNYKLTDPQIDTLLNSISSLLLSSELDILNLLIDQESFIHKLLQNSNANLYFFLIALFLYIKGDFANAQVIIYTINLDDELDKFPILLKVKDLLINGNSFTFTDSEDFDKLISLKEKLSNRFAKTNDRYLNTISNEHKFIIAEQELILPKLDNCFQSILNSNFSVIENLKDPNFAKNLFESARKKFNLPNNKAIFRNYDLKIKDFVKDIIDLSSLSLNLKDNTDPYLISNKDLLNDITKLSKENSHTKVFTNLFNNNISNNSTLSLSDQLFILLSKSNFFISHFPNLIANIQSENISLDFLETNLLSKNVFIFDDNIIFDILIRSKAYNSLMFYFKDSSKIEAINSNLSSDLEMLDKNESFISKENYSLEDSYFHSKKMLRLNYCLNLSNKIIDSINQNKKNKTTDLNDKLDNLIDSTTSLRLIIKNDKNNFQRSSFLKINEALDSVNKVYSSELFSKIDVANEIISEVKHLIDFKESSLSNLELLLQKLYENNNAKSFAKNSYEDLILDDVVDLFYKEDFAKLGLSKSQWQEISDNRKDDIIALLNAFTFLINKDNTFEFINSSSSNNDILENLENIHDSFCRICNLFKNNSKNSPKYPEWKRFDDIPFFFYTKIRMPRCEALDKDIRIFVISNVQLKNKVSLNAIRDYLSDKNDTSFNLIMLLGDRAKLDKINTHHITKNIPILDFSYLKKIILSTKQNKIPKWIFASLLTLNENIEAIHPFKSENAINSNNGIFVGRKSILDEILNNSKDFAVYGGRKIGKSSLLSEIYHNLKDDDNYVVVHGSFLGTDSLIVAKNLINQLNLAFDTKYYIDSLDDFLLKANQLFFDFPDKKVIFLLDEVDEYIIKEKDNSRHQIIEIFRSISNSTSHKWRFVFAGYKEMYLQIHGKGKYEGITNPWQNFIDDSIKQLSEIETPQEVINEGLGDVLGLEFDREVSDRIKKYSTGHPAFLQFFCQCLVKTISNKISINNRIISIDDVEKVFHKDSNFIRYVKETLDLNLSNVQKIMLYVAGIERLHEFSSTEIKNAVNDYLKTFNVDLDHRHNLDLELQLLNITGVIKTIDSKGVFVFSHPQYIDILKRLDNFNKDYLEDILHNMELI